VKFQIVYRWNDDKTFWWYFVEPLGLQLEVANLAYCLLDLKVAGKTIWPDQAVVFFDFQLPEPPAPDAVLSRAKIQWELKTEEWSLLLDWTTPGAEVVQQRIALPEPSFRLENFS